MLRSFLSSSFRRNRGRLNQRCVSYSPCFFDLLSKNNRNIHFSSFVDYNASLSENNSSDDADDLLKDKIGSKETRMINLLMKYKLEHGDCHVPTGSRKHIFQERERLRVSIELANWVVKQRKLYRQSTRNGGKSNDTFTAKVVLLELMGFMWSCREAQWQRSFNRLESHGKENNGSLFVKKQDDHQLYTWIEQQRKSYRKGVLSVVRESLLTEIGFVFDPTDVKWWANHKNLCQYQKENGDTMVPSVDDEGEPNHLGQWVARQRLYKKKGILSECKVEALNDLEFSWEPDAESWDRYYNQLVDFHEDNGHTRVPSSMSSLRNWVDRQRRCYRKRLRLQCDTTDSALHGTLITNGNIQKLSNIGFEWDDIEDGTPRKTEMVEDRMKRLLNVTFELSVHDEMWAKNFQKICQFHEKFRHFSIPLHSIEFKELNTWARHQRYLYNAQKLPKNRIELLDSIGFSWTAEDARWNKLYIEFVSFYGKHHHCDVPITNVELRCWMKQQREALTMENTFDQKITPKERFNKLKDIRSSLLD